jgi:hypothetical protein
MSAGAGVTIGDPQYMKVPIPGKSRSGEPASEGPARNEKKTTI